MERRRRCRRRLSTRAGAGNGRWRTTDTQQLSPRTFGRGSRKRKRASFDGGAQCRARAGGRRRADARNGSRPIPVPAPTPAPYSRPATFGGARRDTSAHARALRPRVGGHSTSTSRSRSISSHNVSSAQRRPRKTRSSATRFDVAPLLGGREGKRARTARSGRGSVGNGVQNVCSRPIKHRGGRPLGRPAVRLYRRRNPLPFQPLS